MLNIISVDIWILTLSDIFNSEDISSFEILKLSHFFSRKFGNLQHTN